MIAPRVKTQAKSPNYSSRDLKWGILCICALNTFGVTTKFEKRTVFQFLSFFVKKLQKITIQNCKKCENSKIDTFCF